MGAKRVQDLTTPHPWTTYPALDIARCTMDCMKTRNAKGQYERITRNPRKRNTLPIPMYPCGNCNALIPRTMALRQAGYCDVCEYMTWIEVVRELVCAINTPLNLHNAGRLPRVLVDKKQLFHRADVMHEKARRRAENRGWTYLASLRS